MADLNHPELQSQKKKIDYLLKIIQESTDDSETKSYLTQYACIRISGFIENCIRIILLDYTSKNAQNNVAVFLYGKLKRGSNPSMSSIYGLIKEFSEDWQKNVKLNLKEQHTSSINSINNQRNLIAHGQDSSITLNDLLQYYSDAVEVVSRIENHCK